MNIRSFFVVLSFIFGVQTISAQSDYGRLLWSGKYTCTGSGFQGMDPHYFMAPFVFEMKIYENVLIYQDTEKYYYQGMKEAYYIKGRFYTHETNGVSFLISEQGVPFIYSESVQNLPFVGNVTTTSIVFVNIGESNNSVVGGFNGGVNYGNGGTVNNGGSYNTQPRQRNCNHCHGTGWCPTCNHTGWVVNRYAKGQSPCPNCNMNGDKVYNPNRGKCPLCGGTGKR